MTPDPIAPGRRRRRCLALLCLLGLLPAAGCGLLLDEFTWLDRAPPPDDPAAAAGAAP